uniref:Pol protein n=1 Tax=Human T-cell leukemia virus type I TaxID=11908 RepID=A0A286T2S2_9DELA|nr:Pol [Human T-cell leukemia virus type I]
MQLAHILQPIRQAFPQCTILQYMDDILLASPSHEDLLLLSEATMASLISHGLPVSENKTQQTPGTIKFLGQIISPNHLTYDAVPTVPIRSRWALPELQALLGEIQWVSKGTPTLRQPLHSLYCALQRHTDPRDQIYLNPSQVQSLVQLRQALSQNCRSRLVQTLPLLGAIMLTLTGTTTVVFQSKQQWPLVWLHAPLPHTSQCPWGQLLASAVLLLDKYTLQSYGLLCQTIHHNISTQTFNQFIQTSDHPSVPILLHHSHRFKNLGAQTGELWNTFLKTAAPLAPVKALMPVFTLSPVIINTAPCLFSDGSTSRAAYILWDKQILSQRSFPLPPPHKSAQQAELLGLLHGLSSARSWRCLNIFLDSKYLYHYLRTLALGTFQGRSSQAPFQALLPRLLSRKVVYLHHVRSHTNLPDPISRLNALTDALLITPVLQLSPAELHSFTHCGQTALTLQGATTTEASNILRSCHACRKNNPQHQMPRGHIRRGLLPNHIWQGDITHFKYKNTLYRLHVWVDTFSGAISATQKRKETSSEAISSLLQAIAYLGKPSYINTDNGPAYISQDFLNMCTSLAIRHTTHVPYNPTSSGLVERSNGILKTLLYKYFTDKPDLPMDNALSIALWTINHLNVLTNCHKTRWQLHHSPRLQPIPETRSLSNKQTHWYYFKLPGLNSRQWKGPQEALQEAAGAALIPVSASSAQWIPWRLLKRAACPRPVGGPADPKEKDHQHHG